LIALGGLACGKPQGRPAIPRKRMTLQIDLQDGFQNDTVIITSGSQRVYEKSGVTTDLTISRADGFEIQVSEPVTLRVQVPTRNATAAESVNPAETPFVAVSIQPDASIQFRKSAVAFLYM
jgi:hypothetical protein